MIIADLMAAIEEYDIERSYAEMNRCPSCDGWGDHGYEEETNCRYICYGCGGTGKYSVGGRK